MPRSLACLLTSCLLCACSFDSTGKGGAGSDSDDGSDTGGTSNGDGGTHSGGSDGTSGTETTTGPSVCQEIVKELVLVADATVTPPMETTESTMGEGTIASSSVAEEGTVSFLVDLPCPDTYYVWGRVNDQSSGIQQGADPDSYYVTVDTGQEQTWVYGCGTSDASQWSWQPVHNLGVEQRCDAVVELAVHLEEGVHTVLMRNREEGRQQRIAAIARVLVTNDPDYVPTDE